MTIKPYIERVFRLRPTPWAEDTAFGKYLRIGTALVLIPIFLWMYGSPVLSFFAKVGLSGIAILAEAALLVIRKLGFRKNSSDQSREKLSH